MGNSEIVIDENSVLPTTRSISSLRILVVDDSKLQRKIVSLSLKKWGCTVVEAGGGKEALAICEAQEIDMVLSDWMMPEMDGLEFCKMFRKLKRDRYGYFILLTSKNDKNDVAIGLDVGADDFLSKPVNSAELQARIRAGMRVLDMETKLVEQNETVSTALTALQNLYEEINKDLAEAEKLQQSLVPVRHMELPQGELSLLYQSSGHVGGDLVGFFTFSPDRLGLYSLDVSGHGVSSALLTARLAGYLSPHSQAQNIAFEQLENGKFSPRSPMHIAQNLNDRMLKEMETELYFTIAYADIDLVSGQVRMVQAGHPHPVIFNPDGNVRFLGTGGPPIGLVPDMEFETFEFELIAGDRLLLYSDGLTECQNLKDDMLDDDGLEEILRKHISGTGPEFMDDLRWEVTNFADGRPLGDDLSAIMFEYNGPEEPMKLAKIE